MIVGCIVLLVGGISSALVVQQEISPALSNITRSENETVTSRVVEINKRSEQLEIQQRIIMKRVERLGNENEL